MTSFVSPWATRVQHLVDVLLQNKHYESDVSTVRVHDSLVIFAMQQAKWLDTMEKDIPRDNPWIASAMLHVVLGDTRPDYPYDEDAQLHAGVAIGAIRRAGWTTADVLQAVHWTRNAMAYCPTVEQWASILDVAPEVVEDAQRAIVPTFVDALTPQEQHAWNIAYALDAPFHSWVEHIQHATQEPGLPLPELGIHP